MLLDQSKDAFEYRRNSRLRILDLGCGLGRHTHSLQFLSDLNQIRDRIDVIGVDLDINDLSSAKNRGLSFQANASWVCADLYQLPFDAKEFDIVICSEVIEHVSNWKDLIAVCRSLLRPHGLFALSFPTAWPERLCWQLDNQYFQTPGGHIRIMDEHLVKEACRLQKLTLIEKYRKHALHAPYWWLRCLFGQNEKNLLVRSYKQFLEWELLTNPAWVKSIEERLDPALGKSTCLVFRNG